MKGQCYFFILKLIFLRREVVKNVALLFMKFCRRQTRIDLNENEIAFVSAEQTVYAHASVRAHRIVRLSQKIIISL